MAQVEDQYRNKLIDRIKSIQDKEVIDELYRLLDIDVNEPVYTTNEGQKEQISIALQQLKDGQGIPEKLANDEIDQWLSK